jgi:hypothetical protein
MTSPRFLDGHAAAIEHVPNPIPSSFTSPEELFVYGPIPLPWVLSAMTCQRNGAKLAWLLWFLVGLKRSWTVAIPTACLRAAGMDSRAVGPALRALEKAGLVSLDSHRGRKPRVTLLQVGRESQRRNYPAAEPHKPRMDRGRLHRHPSDVDWMFQ